VTDEQRPDPSTGAADEAPVRYEATVLPGPAGPPHRAVADLDLDRIPGAGAADEVRLLLTPDDLARLREQGFEVRVEREVPVRPLDPRLVADDETVRAWFDEQTRDARERGEG
jgi:hypothetical protein